MAAAAAGAAAAAAAAGSSADVFGTVLAGVAVSGTFLVGGAVCGTVLARDAVCGTVLLRDAACGSVGATTVFSGGVDGGGGRKVWTWVCGGTLAYASASNFFLASESILETLSSLGVSMFDELVCT
jgi:hypothetical protein